MHLPKPAFRRVDLLQSLISFTLATLLTALLLLQMNRPWHPQAVTQTTFQALAFSPRVVTLPLLPLLPVRNTTDSASVKAAAPWATGTAKPQPHAVQREVQPESLPGMPAETAAPAQVSASEPGLSVHPALLIDAKAVAKAYSDSRRDLQQLAGKSAMAEERLQSDKFEQFGRAVSASAIPDCIQANPEGVKLGILSLRDLLAIPGLAVAALAKKCK